MFISIWMTKDFDSRGVARYNHCVTPMGSDLFIEQNYKCVTATRSVIIKHLRQESNVCSNGYDKILRFLRNRKQTNYEHLTAFWSTHAAALHLLPGANGPNPLVNIVWKARVIEEH